MGRIAILLGLVLLGPALCAADGARRTRTVPELRTFYQMSCASCHGEDGSARAPDGTKLKGFNFTDAKAMQRLTDDALAKAIRKGLFFGFSMPAFKDELSDADIAVLIKEVIRKAEKGRTIGGREP